MKQVVAVVQPFVAQRILQALAHAPLEACSVREVKGFGRQKNYLEEYRGGDYAQAFLPKVEITLWVDELRLEETLRLVISHARTGRMGDGKLFVLDGQSSDAALGVPDAREIDLSDPATGGPTSELHDG